MATFGSDTVANELLPSLLGDEEFPLPDVNLDDPIFNIPDGSGDLYLPITKLTNEDLTTRVVGGTGTFDAMLAGVAAHLKLEFEKGRISGDNYTKAFIEVAASAMGTAVQFLLGKDQSYWQAIQAQLQARRAEIEAVTARVGLVTAKAQLQAAQYQALTAKVQYGLTKIQLANEDAKYGNLLVQRQLLQEQAEAAHAQIADFKLDGTTEIKGQLGAQKELYGQQIISYKRDSDIKGAKVYTDAWIAMKTIDEGLDPVDNFNNASVNTVLNQIRANFWNLPPITETTLP